MSDTTITSHQKKTLGIERILLILSFLLTAVSVYLSSISTFDGREALEETKRQFIQQNERQATTEKSNRIRDAIRNIRAAGGTVDIVENDYQLGEYPSYIWKYIETGNRLLLDWESGANATKSTKHCIAINFNYTNLEKGKFGSLVGDLMVINDLVAEVRMVGLYKTNVSDGEIIRLFGLPLRRFDLSSGQIDGSAFKMFTSDCEARKKLLFLNFDHSNDDEANFRSNVIGDSGWSGIREIAIWTGEVAFERAKEDHVYDPSYETAGLYTRNQSLIKGFTDWNDKKSSAKGSGPSWNKAGFHPDSEMPR